MAMIDFFDQGWSRNPQGAAYIMDERSYTFTEIGELSCRIANGLIAAGFGRGGKAAVLAANDPLAWTCTLGAVARRHGLDSGQSAELGRGQFLHSRRFRLRSRLLPEAVRADGRRAAAEAAAG